ncbi:MAG: DUF5686 and carboxypeptidase regulatory-like domain-containing protein [Cytophagales bacterium]|nr:DUF5686 and carboxypeptidase regulatory-like domain-containing protein [Cytophagales bacterium]
MSSGTSKANRWLSLFVLLFLCLFGSVQLAHGQRLTGNVLDAQTKKPLAFASVYCKSRPVVGTTTDIDGWFSVQPLVVGDTVVFSFVGYETQQYVYQNSVPVRFFLKELSTRLAEVVVRPGENPAWRIVEQTVRNKAKNNPENFASFRYRSYNKSVVRTRNDSLATDTTKNNLLFLNETCTEREFSKPSRSRETVLASRVAGLQDPFFGLVAGDFQPFSYYTDEITVLNKKYVNPVSRGYRQKYDFFLEDTLLYNTDTVFVISFKPFPDKNFMALKGRMGIHSDGYAFRFVEIEPADETLLIRFRLRQTSEKTQGRWFPSQCSSEIIFRQYKLGGKPLEFVSKSYFSDTRLDLPQKVDLIDGVTVRLAPTAGRQESGFWPLHRSDSLTAKESNTYEILDSLGQQFAFINKSPRLFANLAAGRIQTGPIDLLLNRVFRYNLYEGSRLGIGLETNSRLSEFFNLGGYFAYGTRDRTAKYGGWLRLHLAKRNETQFVASYQQDVLEPGTVEYFAQGPRRTVTNVRNLLISRMDWVERFSGEISLRPFTYGQLSVSLTATNRRPNYDYFYVNTDNSQTNVFKTTEAGLGFRYAYKETFRQIGDYKTPYQIASPVFTFYFGQGLEGFLNGEYSYRRFFLKIDHSLSKRYFGQTDFQVSVGGIFGNAPYPLLNIGQGSFGERLNFVYAPNTFQTMRLYEFAADRYAYLFLKHNFGSLLFKPKSKYVRPEINLVQSIGWGDLTNRNRHEGIAFDTPRRGYFESGLLVNNLLRIEYLDLYYIGLGGGAFYRYGPYALENQRDNVVFKFYITSSF